MYAKAHAIISMEGLDRVSEARFECNIKLITAQMEQARLLLTSSKESAVAEHALALLRSAHEYLQDFDVTDEDPRVDEKEAQALELEYKASSVWLCYGVWLVLTRTRENILVGSMLHAAGTNNMLPLTAYTCTRKTVTWVSWQVCRAACCNNIL